MDAGGCAALLRERRVRRRASCQARSTYDPTYGGYFLGKRGILKLRADYQKRMGPKFSLREFHERFMTNGIAPIWAQRQLLLPGDTSVVIQ